MPWCPECKTEYVAGIDRCADCGGELVPKDPNPPAVRKPQEPVLGGIAPGCVGSIIGWLACVVLIMLIAPVSAQGSGTNFGIVLPILCVCIVGFVVGTVSKATFVATLIGWLIVSSPLYLAFGIGFARDAPYSIAEQNLTWFGLFSPLILGPLSTVAGSIFESNRRKSLTLLLVPMCMAIIVIVLGSIIVGRGN